MERTLEMAKSKSKSFARAIYASMAGERPVDEGREWGNLRNLLLRKHERHLCCARLFRDAVVVVAVRVAFRTADVARTTRTASHHTFSGAFTTDVKTVASGIHLLWAQFISSLVGMQTIGNALAGQSPCSGWMTAASRKTARAVQTTSSCISP